MARDLLMSGLVLCPLSIKGTWGTTDVAQNTSQVGTPKWSLSCGHVVFSWSLRYIPDMYPSFTAEPSHVITRAGVIHQSCPQTPGPMVTNKTTLLISTGHTLTLD